MRTAKIISFIAGLVAAPTLLAAEISHTSYTWFCVNDNLAHGLCKSSHSNCGRDCVSINKVCSMSRAGRLIKEKKSTVTDVGLNGSFRSLVEIPLSGTGTIDYCTRNKSKYANWLGQELLWQGTSTNCAEYSRSASKGGEEP